MTYLIAGTPQLTGTIDGTNTVFTSLVPIAPEAVLIWNGLAHIPTQATDNGYTVDAQQVTLLEAPVPGDTVVLWQPSLISQAPRPAFGPTPQPGTVTELRPTLSATPLAPVGSVAPRPQGSATVVRP